jgi:hypothetical protein
VQRLQLILPVISVAVLALRQQSAELDADIALVLSRNACDPLDVEIDVLESLLETMEARTRGHGDPPRASHAPTSESSNA